MRKNYGRSHILTVGASERKIFLELILSVIFFLAVVNIKQACSMFKTNNCKRKNKQELAVIREECGSRVVSKAALSGCRR